MNPTFEELKLTGSLPSPSGVGVAILRLTQDDDFKAEELAATIQSDPALSGRIIKMANSAAAAGIKPITTVSGAAVRLGTQTVRNVSLGFSLISGYREGSCQSFDYPGYWSTSLARAVAAQTLARELRLAVPAEAYLCGLLSDIGKLALATVHPESYSKLLDRGGFDSEAALAAAEKEMFEIDHREVAIAILADWNLPETHGQVIGTYSTPIAEWNDLGRTATRLRQVLRATVPISRIMGANPETQHLLWSELDDAREQLAVDEEQLDEICDGIAAEWREWGRSLSVPTQPVPPFAEIGRRAAEQTAPPPPSAVDAPPPPAPPTPARPDQPAPTPSLSATAGRVSVLVVDDDPVSRRLIVSYLKKADYIVHEAANGNEALQKALEINPHIVVTDWMMPEMDGIELCRSLRKIEIGRDMYIILLTGREEIDRVVEAFEAGADDYVTKPCNSKLLVSRVGAGERLVRLQDELARDKKRMEAQVAEMAILNRKLSLTATTDPLTKLPNRRYAESCLEDVWTSASLALVMVDIDHFKRVNDKHGHDAGDVVLREVSNVLASHLRQSDTVCRLGGEEFLVICPGSGIEGASKIAERLRTAVEGHHIEFGTFSGNVTISLGVAERTPNMTVRDELIKAADVAVYQSKGAGRNRVSLAVTGAVA